MKAHGGLIDIQGVTVAKVDDKVRLQSVETFFDPMDMFHQISPSGAAEKVALSPGKDITMQLHGDEDATEEAPAVCPFVPGK